MWWCSEDLHAKERTRRMVSNPQQKASEAIHSPPAPSPSETVLMPQAAIPKERVERVARIYGSTNEAAAAMGIAPTTFSRLCKKYGIDSPLQRRKKAAERA